MTKRICLVAGLAVATLLGAPSAVPAEDLPLQCPVGYRPCGPGCCPA